MLYPPIQTDAEKIAEAKEYAALPYVAKIARLHALLITKGVSPKYTRARCLRDLVRAVSLLGSGESEMKPPMLGLTVFHPFDNPQRGLFETRVVGIAVATLSALSPFLHQLPRPLTSSLRTNATLRALGFVQPETAMICWDTDTPQISSQCSNDWMGSVFNMSLTGFRKFVGEDNGRTNSELRRNREDALEKLVDLYLRYPAGLFDPEKATKTIAELHSGNVRAFANLFVKLMIYSTGRLEDRWGVRGLPEKVMELDIKSKKSCSDEGTGSSEKTADTGTSSYSTDSLDSRSQGGQTRHSKFVLPRLPEAVREVFNEDETFFPRLPLHHEFRTSYVCAHSSASPLPCARSQKSCTFQTRF